MTATGPLVFCLACGEPAAPRQTLELPYTELPNGRVGAVIDEAILQQLHCACGDYDAAVENWYYNVDDGLVAVIPDGDEESQPFDGSADDYTWEPIK